MTTEAAPLVVPGDVLTVAPLDYLVNDGLVVGTLRVRVTNVAGGDRIPEGLKWAQIMGVRLYATGEDGPSVVVHVRVAALRAGLPERLAARASR